MIPKIVHYCWFGRGDKSDLQKKCINSWKNILKDYTFIEWNEDNFDVNMSDYVKEAYLHKRYAFVSDVARLYALYNKGGIYLDIDVEVKKDLEKFLQYKEVYSFESNDRVATAVIFAEKGSKRIKEWLDTYRNKPFLVDGKENLETNVYKITSLLKDDGFVMNGITQEINGTAIYEKKYFCPYGAGDRVKSSYPDSYTIHWCDGSWFDQKMKNRIKQITFLKRILGTENYYRVSEMVKKIIGKHY